MQICRGGEGAERGACILRHNYSPFRTFPVYFFPLFRGKRKKKKERKKLVNTFAPARIISYFRRGTRAAQRQIVRFLLLVAAPVFRGSANSLFAIKYKTSRVLFLPCDIVNSLEDLRSIIRIRWSEKRNAPSQGRCVGAKKRSR